MACVHLCHSRFVFVPGHLFRFVENVLLGVRRIQSDDVDVLRGDPIDPRRSQCTGGVFGRSGAPAGGGHDRRHHRVEKQAHNRKIAHAVEMEYLEEVKMHF